MEKKKKELTSVSALAGIYNSVQGNGYDKETMGGLSEECAYLEKMLGISPLESVLLSFLLENDGDQCFGYSMKDFMGCSNIELMAYDKELSSLVEKRILMHYDDDFNECKYHVSDDARTAIAGNLPFQDRDWSHLSEEGIFFELRKLYRKLGQHKIMPKHALKDIHDMLDANTDKDFVRNCEKSGIRECSLTEQLLFFFLCDRYISFDEKCVEVDYICTFVPAHEDASPYRSGLVKGTLPCMKKGLVTMGNGSDMTDTAEVTLGERVYKDFFTTLKPLQQIQVAKKGLRSFMEIPEKEMFYNSGEQDSVDRLRRLLSQENFKAVQQRLEECGMRKGFNVIFYGKPGTGKTETVQQIARETGRDIYEVDASKIKSKWVGESEKNIRSVFRTYAEMVKKSDITPILLFNEADAVFSSRISAIDSNSAHSHNAVQDIILEEMERMEGILICTTNLVGTLDEAFERRFIYKVRLSSPDKETRSCLWKSLMPGLENGTAEDLAGQYEFTGGNIENISRKSTVEYVLTGSRPTAEQVKAFCEEESWSESRKKIGF